MNNMTTSSVVAKNQSLLKLRKPCGPLPVTTVPCETTAMSAATTPDDFAGTQPAATQATK
jgi:hypothetical protein